MTLVLNGWQHLRSGKVRDLYTNPDGQLLIVASDRISAFDYILPTEIPNKGKLLTQLSSFWFEFLKDVVPNHIITTDVPEQVVGRGVIVKPLVMFPVECVARGYLTGSGWVEYQKTQSVCGIALPAGLVDGSKLPTPIFTPATKADDGEHDMNITFEQCVEILGEQASEILRKLTLALYEKAHDYAQGRGIILADTKFEFGIDDKGQVCLGDEALTPDSSRFWQSESRDSYDKQFVRNWLINSGWDRNSPPPALPDDVVAKTQERYELAFKLITGKAF
ncbi:MAG: phosphoribosylaminoimidazolesuccinocarboxamide synthase [Actinobacteria bacterium]|nr:phosphoribosylaminoimidazolesuccinocarboxamide synthase [Actinomycetota bacterium]